MNFALIAALIGDQNALVFHNTDRAFTSALDAGQQQFVRANFKLLYKFLDTQEGKIAMQTFVNDWQACATGNSNK